MAVCPCCLSLLAQLWHIVAQWALQLELSLAGRRHKVATEEFASIWLARCGHPSCSNFSSRRSAATQCGSWERRLRGLSGAGRRDRCIDGEGETRRGGSGEGEARGRISRGREMREWRHWDRGSVVRGLWGEVRDARPRRSM